ncbi:unnamed protein product [Linum trigynum]|uniref:Ubiquitin carboxyl-terminal hydrolase 7 ICP0-binding domain-containing protein n=1 Tax=Linum trigynum TaxID=586398 RepID=A0AAV2G0F0_9ROSI
MAPPVILQNVGNNRERKANAEQAQSTMTIRVSRDEDIRSQIGKTRYFDLVDHDKVTSFRVPKQLSVNLFKEIVAEELGIPVQFQRFWLWARRQNGTYRPFQVLTSSEENQPVGAKLIKGNGAKLDLFIESHNSADLSFVPLPSKVIGDILLFIKLYQPESDELSYVGKLLVKSSSKPAEVVTRLNEMAGYALDEKIDLYEIS